MSSYSSESYEHNNIHKEPTEVGIATCQVLWSYRLEVGLITIITGSWFGLSRLIGSVPAAVVVAVALFLLLLIHGARSFLIERLSRARWRRRIERALARLEHDFFSGHSPSVRKVRRTVIGVQLVVRLRTGHAVAQLDKAANYLATALRVREVRVEQRKDDASTVDVTINVRDPFGGVPISCPWAGIDQSSLWEPFAIGEDEIGRPILATLVERNLLVGGEPGSAKSNLLQLVAAIAALDRQAKLWLLDPKIVERLARWAPVATGIAGSAIDEAVAVLQEAADEMSQRYEVLQRCGARKIDPTQGLGLHVLVVDELMLYLTDPDKNAVAEFTALLRRLVALGRAAGISVVMATQKPSTDVIPSSIRDLMSLRAAFRCTTRDASDTILGAGWAARGVAASDIAINQPGVCYMLSEGAEPVKLRCYHLADNDLDAIVGRAVLLRR